MSNIIVVYSSFETATQSKKFVTSTEQTLFELQDIPVQTVDNVISAYNKRKKTRKEVSNSVLDLSTWYQNLYLLESNNTVRERLIQNVI